MKDILNSFRLQITERLNSPLCGAFLIAWTCWNHRLLLVLFSDMPVKERFQFIDGVLYKNWIGAWGPGLVFPMAAAAGFVLLYPFPAKWVYAYWHGQQQKLKAIRDKIEGSTLLTRDESRAIHTLLAKKQKEFEELIELKTREVDALKDANVELEKSNYSLRESIRQIQSELEQATGSVVSQHAIDPGVDRVVEILAKNDGDMSENALRHALKDIPQVKFEYFMDEANRLTFLYRSARGVVTLNPAGRLYAVKKKFI